MDTYTEVHVDPADPEPRSAACRVGLTGIRIGPLVGGLRVILADHHGLETTAAWWRALARAADAEAVECEARAQEALGL